MKYFISFRAQKLSLNALTAHLSSAHFVGIRGKMQRVHLVDIFIAGHVFCSGYKRNKSALCAGKVFNPPGLFLY